jgi:hypothetical protein
VHAAHDTGPDLDPLIAHRDSKMVENKEKQQFYLLFENSPTLTVHEALDNHSIGKGPVQCRGKELLTLEVATYIRVGSTENVKSPRSRLRRL